MDLKLIIHKEFVFFLEYEEKSDLYNSRYWGDV